MKMLADSDAEKLVSKPEYLILQKTGLQALRVQPSGLTLMPFRKVLLCLWLSEPLSLTACITKSIDFLEPFKYGA